MKGFRHVCTFYFAGSDVIVSVHICQTSVSEGIQVCRAPA